MRAFRLIWSANASERVYLRELTTPVEDWCPARDQGTTAWAIAMNQSSNVIATIFSGLAMRGMSIAMFTALTGRLKGGASVSPE
jgi:hypothetical protein